MEGGKEKEKVGDLANPFSLINPRTQDIVHSTTIQRIYSYYDLRVPRLMASTHGNGGRLELSSRRGTCFGKDGRYGQHCIKVPIRF